MKKIIFVEEMQLGNFLFQGYILEREKDVISYSIFINNFELPFIDMIPDEKYNVKILFNIEIVNHINKYKTKDKKLRVEIYKAFYKFVINSEAKAAYMVFKKQKLNYVKNSSELLHLKSVYLND